MARCSFCGNTLQIGTGKMYVQKSGKILYFDSMKCEKNMLKIKREARNLKWAKRK